MRFPALLIALPLSALFADAVKLKSGEIVEGKILQSDASGITIEVQFSPTITDERHLDRAEIAGSVVVSPDEVAFVAIRDLRPPDTALTPAVYDDFIAKKLRPFLRQYPTSARATDINAKIKKLDADIARLKAGDVKVAGIWYDPAAYAASKYQIDAAGLLDVMKQLVDAKNYAFALNAFDRLQTAFPASLAYADAVPLAEKNLPKLEQQLTFTVGNLPQTLAQRQAAIDRTPPEQRAPIQAAVDAENARATALADAAQRNGQHFFAILPYDEKGLKTMQENCVQFTQQLATVDKAKLALAAKLIRRATDELDAHHADAAAATIAQLKTTWTEYEGLGRLEERLKTVEESSAPAPSPKP